MKKLLEISQGMNNDVEFREGYESSKRIIGVDESVKILIREARFDLPRDKEGVIVYMSKEEYKERLNQEEVSRERLKGLSLSSF